MPRLTALNAFCICIPLALCAFAEPPATDDAVVCFDFEGGDMQGWRVVEGDFAKLINDREMFRNRRGKPFNKQGKYFLDTVEAGGRDKQTGVVVSPVFELRGPDMSLMVGGGQHEDTYIALCTVDGREILSARGRNDEVFEERTWHAPELVGKRVFLKVVDKNRGGWGHVLLDNFRAKGAISEEATKQMIANSAKRARVRQAREALGTADTSSLRAAIRDLEQTFGPRYPQADAYLAALTEYEQELGKVTGAANKGDAGALTRGAEIADAISKLRREALIANPLVSDQPILFVVRQQYPGDHHNTATLFQTDEINTGKFRGPGAMRAIDFRNDGQVTTLVETPGIARDPEVSFDGTRVVFSMRRRIEEDYKLYEVSATGGEPKQLTFAEGVADIDPVYLPDGGIVFSSTRQPKYCMCNVHIMANLFRMDADGANIHQIGKSTLFEGHSTVMPDGRILYDRWEYVDRNFGDAQGLWTVYPDGTNHAVYWGNNTNSPGGVIDARMVPGTELAACIFGSCHDRPWGALAIIDRRLGVDGREPVVRTWPAAAIDQVGKGNWDAFKRFTPKYEDPYPLSDPATGAGSGKYFLCSRQLDPPAGKRRNANADAMGIFLVDTFGNELLLHTEGPGCYDPMPLAPRPMPPALPHRTAIESEAGTFYVLDVYEGTHMQGVERGSVKYLRVVESPEKRFWTHPSWGGQGVHRPAMNWHDFENKRILGTAPVESDGSAYFDVPAGKFVFFQLLDENGMMVQSMRSGTMVQPGETLGCVGCHEGRRDTPPPATSSIPEALRRNPSPMNGWHGEPRLFSFMDETQPVFTKHCLACHDFGKKGAAKLILAPDRNLTFNTAYNELWRRGGAAMSASGGFIKTVGAGPSQTQPAYSWGSHASKLVKILRAGHNDIKLTPEEFDRVVTWIDLNAPYYPHYSCAFPDNLAGRSPLDNTQLDRLGKLTKTNLKDSANHGRNPGPMVTFDRPELSPCLQRIEDKGSDPYREALAIVEAGKAILAKTPRADMPGYVPCDEHQRRQTKYTACQERETRCRVALTRGEKVYDTP